MNLNVRRLILLGKEKLLEADLPENEARLIAEYVLNENLTGLINRYDEPVSDFIKNRYLEVVEKRLTRYPLQYIMEEQRFYGIDFYVNEHVLIPRPETEMLVDLGIDFAKKLVEAGRDQLRILDMCTGSGCIAVSVANELEALNLGVDIMVIGADVSEKALEVASENGKKVNLQKVDLQWVQSDLFEAIKGQQFDMIISNPPYITPEDINELMPEVRDYEPHLALDGGGDGLDFYREITKNCDVFLEDGGYLLYEIGHGQMEDVKQLLHSNKFKGVDGVMDLGRFERIVYGIKLNKPD